MSAIQLHNLQNMNSRFRREKNSVIFQNILGQVCLSVKRLELSIHWSRNSEFLSEKTVGILVDASMWVQFQFDISWSTNDFDGCNLHNRIVSSAGFHPPYIDFETVAWKFFSKEFAVTISGEEFQKKKLLFWCKAKMDCNDYVPRGCFHKVDLPFPLILTRRKVTRKWNQTPVHLFSAKWGEQRTRVSPLRSVNLLKRFKSCFFVRRHELLMIVRPKVSRKQFFRSY